VKRGLLLGFSLFIVSEAMLFVSLFWAMFHFKLSPAAAIGCIWPPIGLTVIEHWKLPFLNTCLLLTSGFWVVAAHKKIIHVFDFPHYSDITQPQWKNFFFSKLYNRESITQRQILVAIFFGGVFLLVQFIEFWFAPFVMSDGVYGSVFFMITGLHGMHVLVGLLFLTVCWYRMRPGSSHFTSRSCVGFETAAWYWHFVDVVWLFVYVFLYSTVPAHLPVYVSGAAIHI
jgi:heme/copper-type cytochrome/quinol oxidase subunit 3